MEAYRDQYATLFNNGKKVVVIGISVDSGHGARQLGQASRDFRICSPATWTRRSQSCTARPTARKHFDTRNVFIVGPDGRIASRMMKFNVLSADAYTELQKTVAATIKPPEDLGISTAPCAPVARSDENWH